MEQSNSTWETEEHRLVREIKGIKDYLEFLESKLGEMTCRHEMTASFADGRIECEMCGASLGATEVSNDQLSFD